MVGNLTGLPDLQCQWRTVDEVVLIDIPRNRTCARAFTRVALFDFFSTSFADIPRQVLRDIYDTRCRAVFESIGIKTFTIAYSRPPNLQQALTRAQLHQADGKGARHFYSHTPAPD